MRRLRSVCRLLVKTIDNSCNCSYPTVSCLCSCPTVSCLCSHPTVSSLCSCPTVSCLCSHPTVSCLCSCPTVSCLCSRPTLVYRWLLQEMLRSKMWRLKLWEYTREYHQLVWMRGTYARSFCLISIMCGMLSCCKHEWSLSHTSLLETGL